MKATKPNNKAWTKQAIRVQRGNILATKAMQMVRETKKREKEK